MVLLVLQMVDADDFTNGAKRSYNGAYVLIKVLKRRGSFFFF